MPAWFYPQALCVHSGWHWRPARTAREARLAGYVFGRAAFVRSRDVPDSIPGGSGEAAWHTVNAYGGGMQMTLGTYNRAAALSHGRLPVARGNADIAALPAAAQIYAAYLIVESDGGSWSEWPLTGRACGLA